ncbi:hypothetical protein BFV94_4202 [Alteromonas macleodii]|uniref:Uncharacterized protein n=1 Tax=Alteromonas macleodii TaxID=28108 RepID=A0AB36FMI2_ALTMA|nr:hypothetical protein BFV95_4212 [Alteromonas macleodii]OES26746.1 hypothetical protein BFV94_4202 [Alteromonas macleodii]OES27353.1 hypothetical protein BFV93_4196 [Alteromonas macleodii]OES39302.1 hypothetical protein BFV96_4192 [Alteromonas macleodii]
MLAAGSASTVTQAARNRRSTKRSTEVSNPARKLGLVLFIE